MATLTRSQQLLASVATGALSGAALFLLAGNIPTMADAGATAAQALLGRGFRVTAHRGEFVPSPLAGVVMATVHPSSVLRAPDEETRREETRRLTDDLRKQAGEQLAESFERELFKVPAPQIHGRYEEFLTEATGIRYRSDGYLSDMDAGFYSADYLRAWIRSAQLRRHLVDEPQRLSHRRALADDLPPVELVVDVLEHGDVSR